MAIRLPPLSPVAGGEGGKSTVEGALLENTSTPGESRYHTEVRLDTKVTVKVRLGTKVTVKVRLGTKVTVKVR